MRYLQGESWIAVAAAAALTALLALCRWRRPSRRLLEALAVLLVAVDLWYHGHGLLRTLPAAAYRDPPPLAKSLLPVRDRIFVEHPPERGPGPLMRGNPETLFTESSLAWLQPYAGLLWDIPYAFNPDFELLLTAWGQRAQNLVASEIRKPQMAYRYLGVWNVGTVLRQKSLKEQIEALRNPDALPVRRIANSYVLPRFRFVPEVRFHAEYAEALAAARAEGWRVSRTDHWVRPGRRRESGRFARPPRVLEIADEGGRIELRYEAAGGGYFVAATTYDEQWRARLDGAPLAIYPTAACQLGVVLPPGEHRLVLSYREPLLGLGAAVSLAALVLGAVVGRGPGRRRMA